MQMKAKPSVMRCIKNINRGSQNPSKGQANTLDSHNSWNNGLKKLYV